MFSFLSIFSTEKGARGPPGRDGRDGVDGRRGIPVGIDYFMCYEFYLLLFHIVIYIEIFIFYMSEFRYSLESSIIMSCNQLIN